MKRLALAAALLVSHLASAQTVLKIATLAPEGSSWAKLFNEWQRNVETRTAGRVKIKLYAGGIKGDERDFLRKIRLGELHGAAVTAIGLQSISPEIRVLDVARTYDELDHARKLLGADIQKKFEDKGFLLLGWGDVGPIHIFSKHEVKTLDQLRNTKMWQWSDDYVSRQYLEALGVRGVPLGAPEVLPGLSTGQIDTFFATPLTAIAMQWAGHAKFMTSYLFGQATGATVLSKSAWEKLSADDQKIVREEASAMEKKITELVRRDNATSLEKLKSQGLVVVKTSPEMAAEFEKRAEQVAKSQGNLVSPEFRTQVEKIFEGYRKQKK